MFCREQVARVVQAQARFEERGARVVCIGNGTPDMARDFAAQFSVTCELYTDPSRETYAALDFKRSFGMGPSTLKRAGRALLGGHRQGATSGDAWQQGGVVVVSSSGEVLYRHANKGAGDHADLERVLDAIPA